MILRSLDKLLMSPGRGPLARWTLSWNVAARDAVPSAPLYTNRSVKIGVSPTFHTSSTFEHTK